MNDLEALRQDCGRLQKQKEEMKEKGTPCPHDPRTTMGAIGMYHCPECGDMQLAGYPHISHDEEMFKDEDA